MPHEYPEEDEAREYPETFPTAEDLRGVVEEISSHYPPPRLGTELVLLEVSPHRAHAYWNIDVEDYRAAQKQTGMEHAPLVLRLYDITDGTPPERAITAFDIEIQGLQGQWYVDLWKDGRTHVADLGFRDPSGRLIALARSNPVSTPPASESADYHTLAVDTATRGELRVTDLVLDPNLNAENTDVETGAPLETVPPPDEVAAPVAHWPASPSEERPQTAEIHPTSSDEDVIFPWPVAPATPTSDKLHEEVQAYFDRAAEQAAEAPVAPPWQGHEPIPCAPSAETKEASSESPGWPSAETLEQLVPAGGGAGDQGASAPAPSAAESKTAPADTPPPPAPAEPTGPAPASLDQYVSLSSFDQGRREVALEINVELHIHGRVKPGTELTLYGQPVPLRPDGTFSIIKPLPQGAVVLPLLAVDPPAPPHRG